MLSGLSFCNLFIMYDQTMASGESLAAGDVSSEYAKALELPDLLQNVKTARRFALDIGESHYYSFILIYITA